MMELQCFIFIYSISSMFFQTKERQLLVESDGESVWELRKEYILSSDMNKAHVLDSRN